jgi:hypothetical protein
MKKQFLMLDYNLLERTDIDSDSKIILAKVLSLNETPDKCYMSNKHIATFLGLKNPETASRKISKLVKLGYIKLQMETCEYGTRRKIFPTQLLFETIGGTKISQEVNPKLVKDPTQKKSVPPPAESQSIISVDYISLENQLNHISTIISENNFNTGEERWDAMLQRKKLEEQLKEIE